MSQEKRINNLRQIFKNVFGIDSTDTFISPGRIELLGNHTDHNNGKVLVSSVNLNIMAVTSKRDDGKVVFHSNGFANMELSINDLDKRDNEHGTSIALIRGVLFKLKELGYNIGGFCVVSDSTVPKGAGVSSSAAFEVLVAKIVSYYYNNDSIEPFKLAQIAQFAETNYFNKPCGLLDQTGIALGGINYIDFKDTNNPIIKNIKTNIDGYQFIIINTGGDHVKLTHCYSKIKDDMRLVSNYFDQEVLRNVNENSFNELSKDIILKCGQDAYLKAKHYFEENNRVEIAYKALLEKDYDNFLKMMDDSGISSYYQLKNCYVNDENELLPKALKKVKEIDPSCYSRVHGGGFAGTMLMIVRIEKLDDIRPLLHQYFGEKNIMEVKLTSQGTTRI